MKKSSPHATVFEMTNVNQKPKAVLFDWDNTIIISKSLLYEILRFTIQDLNLEERLLDSKVFLENLHLSARDVFPKIFGERWKEAMEIYEKRFANRHLETLEIMPGIVPVFKLLAEHGVTMAVVSNKEGYFVRKEAEHLKVSEYFHKIIGSFDAESDKPSPLPAYLALQELWKPEEFGADMWFIGDSLADLECGYNAKCSPILLGENGFAIKEAQRKNISYTQVQDHKEFLNLLVKYL